MDAFTRGRKLAAQLVAMRIDNDRDYRAWNKRVDSTLAELRAAWCNPADQVEAANVRADLIAAWDAAAHYTA
jgi:hypothetical protein